MANCSPSELDDEWGHSVLVLSEILGEPVEVASVPGGYYSHRVAVAAARAGIKLLFNSEPVTRSRAVDGCLILGRFTAQRATPPGWSAAIVTGQWKLQIREYCFWNAKKVGKFLLGGVWVPGKGHAPGTPCEACIARAWSGFAHRTRA